MKWFKHESQASQDAKLKKLRIKYGMEGYGLYWYCVELIAREVEADNLTFELEHDSEILAFDTGIHHDRIQEMMAFMVQLGLFQNSNGIITCKQLAKRADEYLTKAIRRRESRVNPDSVQTKTDKVRLEEKRREEKRVDKSKDKNTSAAGAAVSKRFKPPTVTEAREYFFAKWGDSSEAERFVDFYTSKDWHVGKSKMKDWQASARNWMRGKPSKPTGQVAMDDFYSQLQSEVYDD